MKEKYLKKGREIAETELGPNHPFKPGMLWKSRAGDANPGMRQPPNLFFKFPAQERLVVCGEDILLPQNAQDLSGNGDRPTGGVEQHQRRQKYRSA